MPLFQPRSLWSRSSVAVLSTVTVLALLVSGCSDDADPRGADPTSEPTSTQTPEPTTPEPTTPEPTTPPGATGPALALAPLTLRVPEGFTVIPALGGGDATARGSEGVSRDLIAITAFPLFAEEPTLAELTEAGRTNVFWKPAPQVLPTRTVDGVEMAHLVGSFGGFKTDQFLATVAETSVQLNFSYGSANQTDRAGQQALIDEVLATAEWSG